MSYLAFFVMQTLSVEMARLLSSMTYNYTSVYFPLHHHTSFSAVSVS